jgi:hypothetical protein
MTNALSIAAAAAREGDGVCPEAVTPLMVCSEAGTIMCATAGTLLPPSAGRPTGAANAGMINPLFVHLGGFL